MGLLDGVQAFLKRHDTGTDKDFLFGYNLWKARGKTGPLNVVIYTLLFEPYGYYLVGMGKRGWAGYVVLWVLWLGGVTIPLAVGGTLSMGYEAYRAAKKYADYDAARMVKGLEK